MDDAKMCCPACGSKNSRTFFRLNMPMISLSNIKPETLAKAEFTFIDGDRSRKGLIIPVNGLNNYPILHSEEAMKLMNNESALVIASMYSNEILNNLKNNCLKPNNYIVVTL